MENKILDNIKNISDIKSLENNELRQLADEVRSLIINTVSKNGGHLAANLGAVELTIALHRIFKSPEDKIIFDVGHQCYTHKILTGRKSDFHTLRKDGGISGFPKREESEHDAFDTGHSSTSISAAVGYARARDLSGGKNSVVAIIGDGAMTGGMVWEALNDAGHYGNNIIIILNDNEMSIGKNVGAISTQLSNMRSARGYIHLKGFVANVLNKIPLIGKPLKNFFEHIKNSVKYLFIPNEMFEQMGFNYYGIVDGHDIADLEKIFTHVKYINEPVLIHVKTQKGKGAKYSEEKPQDYHSTSPFDADTGKKYKQNYTIPNAMGTHLAHLADFDDKICGITASMENGCGLDAFKKFHPEKFFDVGIAEQHAVTMACGMAAGGYKPVFFVYSTFLQRAYDQILHDMCIQKLPVTIVAYNSGVVGDDGETHHGVFSVSFLRHIPNINIIAPSSIDEAKEMLEQSVNSNKPTVILMSKSMPDTLKECEGSGNGFSICSAAKNSKIAVLAYGSTLHNAIDAVKNSDLKDLVDVYSTNILKPVDTGKIREISDKYDIIVTIEDNVLMGGFGSSVLESMNDMGIATDKVTRLGHSDSFLPQGSVSNLHKMSEIDKESIYIKLKALISNEKV